MFDRMSMWIGAGAVTAGVSAAMLAGAGVAIASTESSAGGDTSTSDASGPGNVRTERDQAGTDTEADSRDDDPDGAEEVDDTDVIDADTDETEDVETDDTETDTDDTDDAETEADDGAEAGSDAPAGAHEVDVEAPLPVSPVAEPLDVTTASILEAPDVSTAEIDEPTGPATELAVIADTTPTPEAEAAAIEPTSAVARLTVASAAAETTAEVSAPKQTLLSLVGTIVFNLYSFAVRVFGGPPLLPWGSTVTVRSSKVEIDCGDGYVVPADWYVPEGATPTRLIYLQHGFLAAGPFYSYTASRLAEATHSIVVTTSLTSNFLACDGCWVSCCSGR
ncbi:MAG: hypothetical protein U1C73_07815, partial [Dietzia sp.]|nr:hypothetical protein [Dietzia sp.]